MEDRSIEVNEMQVEEGLGVFLMKAEAGEDKLAWAPKLEAVVEAWLGFLQGSGPIMRSVSIAYKLR